MEPPTLRERGWVPKRYVVALMAFLGMVCNYMLRVNINLTIVYMVKPDNSSNASEAQDVCGFGNDTSDTEDQQEGDFEWDEWMQGLITGSFFWGYLWTQIPGGRTAEVFGARRVFGGALLVASLVTLLVPVAAWAGSGYLIAVRVLLGIAEGPTFPSTHALLSSWAPPLERSRLATIIYAGSQAGTIVAYPLSAVIVENLGWEAVFYIQACITLVWCVVWFLVVSDYPSTDRFISQAERDYIYAAIGDNKNKTALPVPLTAILTSLPFWAILVANVGNNWGFYTLLTDLPLYMKEMLNQDIHSNALLSGMPYLGMWMFSLAISVVGDWLMTRGLLTTGAFRKIANTIAHGGPTVCLLALALVECNKTATVVLLFVAVTLQGGIYSAFVVNHVDISPNFAGTMYGISNAASTIPGWLAPMTVGALTNNQQTFAQWRKVFYISAGIYAADTVFFLLFSSGEVQQWNKVATKDEEHHKTANSSGGQLSNLSVSGLDKRDSLQNKTYDAYVLNPNYRTSYTNQAYHPG